MLLVARKWPNPVHTNSKKNIYLTSFYRKRAKGNATKTVPKADFSSPAFAALFQRAPPPQQKSKRGHPAIIAGAVVGALAFLVFVGTTFYLQRNWIAKYVNGAPDPAAEIGESKEVKEIMDREVFWELDAQDNRPAARGFMHGWRESARGIMHGGVRAKVAELDTKKDGMIGDERNAVAELDAEKGGERNSTDFVAELNGKKEGNVVKGVRAPQEGEWF